MRATTTGFLSTLSALALGLALLPAGTANAQFPELTPGGPWVQPDPMGNLQVPAGRTITWEVAGLNVQPAPLAVTIVSEPQNVECDPGGMNAEFGVFGGTMESAPQPFLTFIDNNDDGDCDDAGETVVDSMGAPTQCLIDGPNAQPRLEIQNLTLDPFAPFAVSWLTDVDPMAAPVTEVCSWAHLVNPMTGELLQSTRQPGAGMDPPACSCLTIVDDGGLDVTVTKTATPDTLPLVPGDPASTITYEITVTNTGSQDIMNASLTDDHRPDNLLEWTEVITCDPPLVCSDVMADPTILTVTGFNLNPLEMDGTCAPGNTCSETIVARAAVTCDAATDDDSGVVCNQAEFNLMLVSIPSDDPDAPGDEDATCTPVVFSNLTQSEKTFEGFDDANGNGQLDNGETVNFSIRARNSGRLTATNVVVTDELFLAGCWAAGSADASASGGVVMGDFIQWDLGDLAPGEFQDLPFTVVLDSDSLCCNQAQLQSEEREGCGLNNTIPTDDPTTPEADDSTCASPGPQPDLQIEKTWCVEAPPPPGGCPGTAMVGDQIRWTITVTNNGAGVATAAELRDDFNLFPCNANFGNIGPVDGMTTDADGMWGDAGGSRADTGGFPRDFGELIVTDLGGPNGIQPGETITIGFSTTTRFSAEGCCNQAQVTYAERAGAAVSDDPTTPGRPLDESCLNVEAVTEGELQKTATLRDVAGGAPDGFISIGDEVEYSFEFANVGSNEMTNVAITDASQPCVTLDSATLVIVRDDTGMAVDMSAGDNVDLSIASILPAERVHFTIIGTVAAVGPDCCNQAAWTSDQAAEGGEGVSDLDVSDLTPDQETCFDAVSVPMPMLTFTKAHDAAGCLAPGSTVNYTLTVVNNGTAPVDTWDISDDVAPLGGCAAVMVTAPLTCDGGTDTVVVDSAADGSIDAMGGMRTYRYSVDLPCAPAEGSEDPVAAFNYDPGSGVLTLNDTAGAVDWGFPDLSGSQKEFNWDAGDMNGDGRINPGTPENDFSYTITVRNSGSCDATGVMVTDTYPASFVITDAGGGVDDGTTITWDLGTVPAGGMMAVTFTASIDEVMPPSPGNIVNDFSVSVDNDGSACGLDANLTDQGESTAGVPWDVGAAAEILRNALVSCRPEATTVYDRIFSGAEPQIDAAGPGTTATPAPGSPIVFAGDADTAASNDTCPQEDPAGANLDNRVLIFYEYTGDPATIISVAKNGADVEVSW